MVNQSGSLRERLISQIATEPLAREIPLRAQAAVPTSVIRHLDNLARLADEWDAIATQAGSPTQQYIWAEACAAAFESAGRLQIVTVEQAGQTAAIAPFVRRQGLPRLELLGVKELYEPMDLLCSDLSALDQLASAIAELPLPIWIERVPGDSPLLAAVKKAYKRRGLVYISPAQGYPVIPLDEGWAVPELKFNAGRRSDFRRAQRNAERLGTISYEIHSPTPDECEPLLEEALRVEAASWKGTAGSAIEYDKLRAPFYRRYAASACAKGILRLCFLRIGGQAAAMQYAIECGGRFWLLKIGYDETFARCSPGMLLMLHSIGDAARRGLRSYEFLGTAEPWTQMWTQEVRPAVSIRAYPAAPLAMATLTADAARFMWAKLKKRVGGKP